MDCQDSPPTLMVDDCPSCTLHEHEMGDPVDGDAFDRLARRVDLTAGRRSVLRALAGVGMLGAALASDHDADAKRRKRKKKKKKCLPESAAKTCAGRCRSATNNCGTLIVCDSTCPACQRCASNSRCEADPTKVGTDCGDNLVCQGDGKCVACGLEEQPCCAGSSCEQAFRVCDFGTCKLCGRSDEVCCANQTCDPGRVCLGARCKDCGVEGKPCCAGNSCTDGSTCQAGTCVD